MTELCTLEQVALSLLVNGIALALVLSTKSAPPRFLLWICMAGMSAIFMPWSLVGSEVEGYIPAELASAAGISQGTLASTAPVNGSAGAALIYLWFGIGLTWLSISVLRSVLTRKQWRSRATVANDLAKQGDMAFARELTRTSIYRIPNSSSVFSTGLLRPEIWIGDGVSSPAQIETALNHELSHIASNDQLTLLFLVAVERLLWWNPLIWLLGQQARRQMEYACDARCESLMGAKSYRDSLAELFLRQQPRTETLEMPLGNNSDIINRLEKIGMTHSVKSKHIVSFTVGGLLIALASTNLAAETVDQPYTLIKCHELVPEGVRYDFKITSDIDTRAGQQGELSVTLVDASNPDSTKLPDGAGEFVQCVQKVVGIGNDEGWPEAQKVRSQAGSDRRNG